MGTPDAPIGANEWCRMVLREGPEWAKLNGTKWHSSHASVVLCLHLHLGYQALTCFPTQETIARLTRFGRRTVVRAVGDLVDLGFIETAKRGRGLLYRAVSPVHMSRGTCESDGSKGALSAQRPVHSVHPELIDNSKRTPPELTGYTPATHQLSTTIAPETGQTAAINPRRWTTRARELETLLSEKDQAKIRRSLEMGADADVTFQALMQLTPDSFEALWKEYRPAWTV